jgi:hypothetical protein
MTAGSKYWAGTVAVLLLAAGSVLADNTKKPAAAPKAAPAKPAAKPAAGGGAARPGGAGGAAHGPTTTGGAHGPTTTGGAKTTTGGGATTTGGRGATTTGGAAARPAAGGAAAGARPTAGAGGARAGGAAPASRSMPHTASGAAPKGSTMRSTPKGDQVRMRAGGKPGDVHVAGKNMDIHHGLAGGRTSRVERADHSRVVAERGHRGYVQHAYGWHGHEYGHRTYWAHGRAYDRFYGRYGYHGVYMDMYSPVAYYPPAFYGWAYNPWAVPIAYPVAAWGWGGAPWFGFYGAYFTPFPVYASASLWLTDYMISTTLAAAYQANADAAAAQQQLAADAAPLTPDIKNLVAQEVQRQIAVENAEAAPQAQEAGPNPAVSGVQRLLNDNQSHVFVAGASLDVVDANNNECAVSDGDVLQLTPTPLPDDATAATLVVMTSKGGVECKKGAAVTVNIEDLQEMQNHMREAIDTGMGELKDKQGKGGLPALPPSAAGAPVKAQFAMDAPPPDATAGQQIDAQAADADKSEQEVLAQAGSGPADVAAVPAVAAPQAAPIEIGLGLTVEQVTNALGQPKNIVDLGPKKIYVFKDMKVTFKDGKVTDVQ